MSVYDLASQGLHVFPVDHPSLPECAGLHTTTPCDGKRGKHPAVAWGHAATSNPKMVATWFEGRTRNVGISCGPSGLVVLDEDEPDALQQWAGANGVALPGTYTVTTGKGRHLYYAYDHAAAPIRNASARLFGVLAVDVRGQGGFVVAEGSAHQGGTAYVGNDAPITRLPAELAQRLLAAQDAPTGNARTEEFFADHNSTPIPYGKRHRELLKYAGRLRKRGLDYAEAEILFRKRFELCEQPPGKEATYERAKRTILDDVYARYQPSGGEATASADDETPPDDGETVKTVPWPTLSATALHGTAGQIVKMAALHTEADPAALLVQLLAVFGATLGPGPHFVAGNNRHQAVIHPLVVGRTNSGAKGTSLGVVEAICQRALPWFGEFTTSGLTSAEGLIELVRDSSGDPASDNYDPGVSDKRLLVKESEYRSVLSRCRRDGNTLAPILRQCWDGGTLRTLARKHNKLTATDPHIVVIGHVTPREFRTTLDDSDLSGGSVNRLLICLSRRARLNARLGNIPDDVLARAAALFDTARRAAQGRSRLEFTDEFWSKWDGSYRDLNRDRPDSWSTDATARAVTQVLRLALIYALFDGAEKIDVEHLDAALALWAYAEHSARWLFSTHEQEISRETAGGLAAFIRSGGPTGQTRTQISRDYFKGNRKAAEITAELTSLVHNGVALEIKDETGARPITRYVHSSLRTNEFTNYAGHDTNGATKSTNCVRTEIEDPTTEGGDNSYEFVVSSYDATPSEQHNSLNSLIRTPDRTLAATRSRGIDRALMIAARLNDEHAGNGSGRSRCPCGRPAPVNTDTGLCQWCDIKAASNGGKP